MSEFHNPYHFVPVKENGSTQNLAKTEWLATPGHVTHDRYTEGAISGRIVCRLMTETPIFVGSRQAQPPSVQAPGKVLPFELDEKPAIPASTLRGLISSIAEAASNSALRVLEDEKYSYRRLMDPNQPEKYRPLSAIGMIVEQQTANGNVELRLRPLTLPLMEFKDGDPARLDPHWQPLYPEPNLKVYLGDQNSIRRADFSYQTYTRSQPEYFYLKLQPRNWVNGALPRDGGLNVKANKYIVAQKARSEENPRRWEEIPQAEQALYTRGILRVLGCTTDRSDIPTTKKHELFIPYPEAAESWPTFPLRSDALERFYDLADQRTEQSANEPSPWPYEPKGTTRNSDVTTFGSKVRLKDGDLVWFRSENSPRGVEIAEISFSSIWRGRVETNERKAATTYSFFAKVCPDLLPFHPGRTSLTVAEQLFGFVEASKETQSKAALALAGRVYFSHARLVGFQSPTTKQWDEEKRQAPYSDEVTLRILDSPKPPSPSLYFRKAGKPGYLAKRELSPSSHHPQGRKMYLHHREQELRNKPWESKPRANLADNRYQQKVAITPLKPGAVFYFHVDFHNLSAHELGLLLYALQPTEAFRHKIGMGKPLGLGRVRLQPVGVFQINRQDRYSEEGLFAARYNTGWRAGDQADWPTQYVREANTDVPDWDALALKTAFENTMDLDIKNALELLGNPKAVKAAVHTPLVEDGDPEDETFQWFVANDTGSGDKKKGTDIPAQTKYLVPLTKDSKQLPTLPLHPWAEEESTHSHRSSAS